MRFSRAVFAGEQSGPTIIEVLPGQLSFYLALGADAQYPGEAEHSRSV